MARKLPRRYWIVLKSPFFISGSILWFEIINLISFLSLLYSLYCLLGLVTLPHSFSKLINLAHLHLIDTNIQGFKNSLLLNQFFYILNIEEEFPSCFQNMTRLTVLELSEVRDEDQEQIPFPTQFCNMIYLQRFTSNRNNFSCFYFVQIL